MIASSTKRQRSPRAWHLLALALSSCMGYIESDGAAPAIPRGGLAHTGPAPSDATGQVERPGVPLGEFACDPTQTDALPRRLWRLTGSQYRHALAVLFRGRSVGVQPEIDVPELQAPFELVSDSDRFSTNASSYTMADQELTRVIDAANRAAAALVARLRADGESCLSGLGGLPFVDCVQALVTTRGPSLFQRPLAVDEIAQYVRIATDNVALLGEDEAVGLAFQALLTSPSFLFRTEVGGGAPTGQSRVRLSQFELASALSYSLTDWPPTTALYEAAQDGQLSTPEEIAEQVKQLLAAVGPAPASVTKFVGEYFRIRGLEKVFKSNADLNADNRDALIEDSEALIGDLVASSASGSFFQALLTTHEVRYRTQTSALYGLADPNERLAFARASLPERAGLLTQPAWLASLSSDDESHPVARGRFISESLLCRAIPPVPIGVVPVLPDDPSLTTREKLALHSQDPSCAACHRMMDPLGLVFEAYDQNGRVRKDDNGKPVDASGALDGSGSQDGPLSGPVDLAGRLAASEVVQECMIRHSFRYWMGRSEAPWDGCTLVAARDAYLASDGDYIEMLANLFASSSFQYRSTQ